MALGQEGIWQVIWTKGHKVKPFEVTATDTTEGQPKVIAYCPLSPKTTRTTLYSIDLGLWVTSAENDEMS